MDYLKGIFVDREDNSGISDSLLVLHIKLLCQLNPSKVLEEVKAYTYPLDECMKLCKEYNVKDALGFFLERAGNLTDALNIALELFRKLLEESLITIEKEGVFSKYMLGDKRS